MGTRSHRFSCTCEVAHFLSFPLPAPPTSSLSTGLGGGACVLCPSLPLQTILFPFSRKMPFGISHRASLIGRFHPLPPTPPQAPSATWPRPFSHSQISSLLSTGSSLSVHKIPLIYILENKNKNRNQPTSFYPNFSPQLFHFSS